MQAQVVNLLQDLQQSLGLSYLFIAHDLAVIKHIASRVAVMYMGRIVELGDTQRIFSAPRHPYTQALMQAIPLPEPGLRREHADRGIVTEAWSPLAVRAGLLDDPVVTQVAASHGVSPAQVVLRWHIELGNVVLTRSVTPSRISDNFDIFGFQLTDRDHEALASLDRGQRTGPDPDRFWA